MAFQSQKNPIITCEQYLWGSGTPTLTCKCKRTLVNLGLEIYDKQPDICLAQKCPTPKLSQRLLPHPHPGTSAIIFTTGNSKVVNSFRGWYLCFEIVVALWSCKMWTEPSRWRPWVWDHQSGEVYRYECEWQQQADPNLLCQDSQKK